MNQKQDGLSTIFFLAGVMTLFGVLLAGCSDSAAVQAVTVAPTPKPIAVATVVVADVPNPVTAPAPVVEDCNERDPKKWSGFGFKISLTEVVLTNASSCVRVVTFRAFSVGAGNSQSDAGEASVLAIAAGAGVGLTRPYVHKVHYYGTGLPPCGAKIQIDGRAGSHPQMTHDNASFVAGELFDGPFCPVPPIVLPPSPSCVDPGWGPWLDAIAAMNNPPPPVCKKQVRTRTLCNGQVQREERTVCQ